jgi:hypothetical protein
MIARQTLVLRGSIPAFGASSRLLPGGYVFLDRNMARGNARDDCSGIFRLFPFSSIASRWRRFFDGEFPAGGLNPV